jgi:hypothetical protein
MGDRRTHTGFTLAGAAPDETADGGDGVGIPPQLEGIPSREVEDMLTAFDRVGILDDVAGQLRAGVSVGAQPARIVRCTTCAGQLPRKKNSHRPTDRFMSISPDTVAKTYCVPSSSNIWLASGPPPYSVGCPACLLRSPAWSGCGRATAGRL